MAGDASGRVGARLGWQQARGPSGRLWHANRCAWPAGGPASRALGKLSQLHIATRACETVGVGGGLRLYWVWVMTSGTRSATGQGRGDRAIRGRGATGDRARQIARFAGRPANSRSRARPHRPPGDAERAADRVGATGRRFDVRSSLSRRAASSRRRHVHVRAGADRARHLCDFHTRPVAAELSRAVAGRLLVVLSILADIALLLGLIWSFHVQYGQDAAFSLKVPTFIYIFLFVALERAPLRPALRADGGRLPPRSDGACCWCDGRCQPGRRHHAELRHLPHLATAFCSGPSSTRSSPSSSSPAS